MSHMEEVSGDKMLLMITIIKWCFDCAGVKVNQETLLEMDVLLQHMQIDYAQKTGQPIDCSLEDLIVNQTEVLQELQEGLNQKAAAEMRESSKPLMPPVAREGLFITQQQMNYPFALVGIGTVHGMVTAGRSPGEILSGILGSLAIFCPDLTPQQFAEELMDTFIRLKGHRDQMLELVA